MYKMPGVEKSSLIQARIGFVAASGKLNLAPGSFKSPGFIVLDKSRMRNSWLDQEMEFSGAT